ncbi:MAG: imidazole glycerol phosphate synthase subunit HisH [Candidatus Omnitrophota bacterium]
MSSIAVIDYGMGNIHSVKKALEAKGAVVSVTNSPEDIRKADKLVLPGVGAFGDAMLELEKQGLVEAIKGHIASGKIFLGICLGMHLLFEKSQESEGFAGLGVLKGTVRKFSSLSGLKVPHMGWNQIGFRKPACKLFKGIPEGSSVYFCHSYYPQPEKADCVAAVTEYGPDFASIIWQDNVYAMQFHPEKSQAAGLALIENFVRL